MEPIKEIQEKKELVLKRVPPGDRWTSATKKSAIFNSLTEGLEYVFQETKCTEYHLSSFKGEIYMVQSEEVEIEPEPPTKYSLYGEY